MPQPFVGEIRMFAGNFAPTNWSFCDGSLLAISQNSVLFQLIGTTYGGDGVQTFALPNLLSRVPVHAGTSGFGTFALGQSAGAESVTLTTSQIPVHSHVPQCSSNAGSQASPAGGVWAVASSNRYSSAAPAVTMATGALATTGGSQSHDNMVPFLVINFIISLFGIFPSQN